jgi:hypothetical protein
MTAFQVYISITVSILGILVIPLIGLLIRGAMKWTRVEDKLDSVVKKMADLVDDKNRVHLELASQMREDRKATDRRLRWLEEHTWKNGDKST